MKPTFYEFFAGGGMARAGLGSAWQCLFANDISASKARSYRLNWPGEAFCVADVATLSSQSLPAKADLAWASFPCQDLSLAGSGAGLEGKRSGTYRPFWDLMLQLGREQRAPRCIVLENVCGALTSHGGNDFRVLIDGFVAAGYRPGAVVIDAKNFVPQSRPRLFVIGVHASVAVPPQCMTAAPVAPWHTKALRAAHAQLAPATQDAWVWWALPEPKLRTQTFIDILEPDPQDTPWYDAPRLEKLMGLMSDGNLAKIKQAQSLGHRVVGGVYKRTRPDASGHKKQRAEVRFDGVSGCLRTPVGGSSRQLILVVEGASIRARLISRRETARLMGLAETYQLPENYNEAYHLAGDGLVVPVVRHLAKFLLEPILGLRAARKEDAA